MMIPWRGPAENSNGQPTFRSYSFYDVFYSQQQIIEGQKPGIDPALFKDRIVIVGVTAEGLNETFHDAVPARRDQRSRSARQLVDALLSNRSIARAPAMGDRRARHCGAVAVGIAGAFLNAWFTGARGVRVAALLAWLSVALFARGTWIPVTVPLLALVFAFVGDLAWQYFVEGREKRQVKQLFSRYVSKDVYDQLLANPALAALGGARRHMTVLFSDMRGFTAMSEKGTPEDVVAQLNELFSRMVAVVFAHHGTVDKFVGDMVMALFGAPLDDDDHAEHAVQTALAMITALERAEPRMGSAGQAARSTSASASTPAR